MELWKLVQGTNGGYEVSSLGRVMSRKRRLPKLLKTTRVATGYCSVNIVYDDAIRTRRVHRLVAESFIPNPEGKPQVNHKNGIKHDNRVENLEWCTREENQDHANRTGLSAKVRGEGNGLSRLTETEVLEIRASWPLGCFTLKDISEAYGICEMSAHNVVHRKTWAHI